MVLVDGSDEDQADRMAPVPRSIMKLDEEWHGTEAVLRVLLLHVGILHFLSRTNPGRWGIPESLREELDYLSLQQKAIQSKAFQAEVLFPEDTGEVRAAGNLGNKPLIVLTRGKNLTPCGMSFMSFRRSKPISQAAAAKS
jgi:hypothetical protein